MIDSLKIIDYSKKFDYNDIIYQIDIELKRIGWSVDRAKQYLEFAYGVKSRLRLNDTELLEFLNFLQNYQVTSKFKIKLTQIPKIKLPKLTKIVF